MSVTPEMVKELRGLTGAGVLNCKEALEAAEGDMERAQQILREKGQARAAKKAEREAKQGLVEGYVHMGKAGALVELNCETDFVARTPQFHELAHDLAMQVVATRPRYVRPEDIPAEVLEQEKAKYQAELAHEKKPEHVMERILEGKLTKFRNEVCMVNQPFIRDQEKTVQDVINEAIASIGENIVLRRFAYLALEGDQHC
jgi:elongation factor Ts